MSAPEPIKRDKRPHLARHCRARDCVRVCCVAIESAADQFTARPRPTTPRTQRVSLLQCTYCERVLFWCVLAKRGPYQKGSSTNKVEGGISKIWCNFDFHDRGFFLERIDRFRSCGQIKEVIKFRPRILDWHNSLLQQQHLKAPCISPPSGQSLYASLTPPPSPVPVAASASPAFYAHTEHRAEEEGAPSVRPSRPQKQTSSSIGADTGQ